MHFPPEFPKFFTWIATDLPQIPSDLHQFLSGFIKFFQIRQIFLIKIHENQLSVDEKIPWIIHIIHFFAPISIQDMSIRWLHTSMEDSIINRWPIWRVCCLPDFIIFKTSEFPMRYVAKCVLTYCTYTPVSK